MPTVNCSAFTFTASNVGRLLRGDCRYWTVVFEVWSALIVTWATGVAIHATFQNRHFRPPKIRGLGLGRTEEKFADSDANSESVTTLALSKCNFKDHCGDVVITQCLGKVAEINEFSAYDEMLTIVTSCQSIREDAQHGHLGRMMVSICRMIAWQWYSVKMSIEKTSMAINVH